MASRLGTDKDIDRVAFGAHQLNLTRLRYFVAVAQELHFGRAASRLGISQPPLSLHIKALEEQVGAKLLTRTNRHVALTVSGRILLDQATQLLDHAERVSHVMQGVGAGEIGELFVGCVPSALYDVLPKAATHFRKAYPNIHLVIEEAHTADVMKAVADGRHDVGLVWKNLAEPPLESEVVLEEQFVAVVPADHPLAAREVLSLEELAPEPLILPPRKISPYHYDHILASFVNKGLRPRIEYEVPTILSQIGFAASGCGIAISPGFARTFATERVVVADIEEKMAPVLLSLVWNKARMSPPVSQFRDVVGEVFRDARDRVGEREPKLP
ncbi:LysR family transcriptional regulator [Microbaculum marinum]|uniref:LysR substrate-binding domain-containing protein n=1 Tax=Microbaculum marinum TaxID=1764581 RepID=A0AAW9RQ44_9HYPH